MTGNVMKAYSRTQTMQKRKTLEPENVHRQMPRAHRPSAARSRSGRRPLHPVNSILPRFGGGARRAEGAVPDMPLALVEGTTLYQVHTDHLGRPNRVTDAVKATVWQATYKPFGAVQSISGSILNNLRFPGQYFQLETNLAYNWHRTYDPTTGRYTQPDPLRFVDGPSVYTYAGSSPFMNVDPTGEFGFVGAGIGGGLEIASQLISNGGNYRCIKWGRIGAAAILGSVTGGIGGGLINGIKWGTKATSFTKLSWRNFNTVSKRLRSNNGLVGNGRDLHHWFIRQNSSLPGWLKNTPWNLKQVPRSIHNTIHSESTQFYKW